MRIFSSIANPKMGMTYRHKAYQYSWTFEAADATGNGEERRIDEDDGNNEKEEEGEEREKEEEGDEIEEKEEEGDEHGENNEVRSR